MDAVRASPLDAFSFEQKGEKKTPFFEGLLALRATSGAF